MSESNTAPTTVSACCKHIVSLRRRKLNERTKLQIEHAPGPPSDRSCWQWHPRASKNAELRLDKPADWSSTRLLRRPPTGVAKTNTALKYSLGCVRCSVCACACLQAGLAHQRHRAKTPQPTSACVCSCRWVTTTMDTSAIEATVR